MSSGLISGTQGAASTTARSARPSAWLPLSAVPGRNAEQRSVEEKKVEAAGWSAIQTSVAICARCRESATDRNDTHVPAPNTTAAMPASAPSARRRPRPVDRESRGTTGPKPSGRTICTRRARAS